LFATTSQFLDDLGLQSLDQLPLTGTSIDQASASMALALREPVVPDTNNADELFFLTGSQP
jgi:segregation and condensation protein B